MQRALAIRDELVARVESIGTGADWPESLMALAEAVETDIHDVDRTLLSSPIDQGDSGPLEGLAVKQAARDLLLGKSRARSESSRSSAMPKPTSMASRGADRELVSVARRQEASPSHMKRAISAALS